jgi:DNA (cytosine-5)-methyltransferase 1
MNELALFAGAGGGILVGKLLGWRTVCAVEIEPYPISVLIQRQNDGILSPFPIWDDVCTFDGKPWRGIVDVVSGGFPCQDISAAGKGIGINGVRSGLWKEFARIINEVRPRFVFVENSPLLRKRGLDRVLSDLATMGYDAEWGVLGASDCGGLHRRKRIWIVAYSSNQPKQKSFSDDKTFISQRDAWVGIKRSGYRLIESLPCQTMVSIKTTVQDFASTCNPLQLGPNEPELGRVANGVGDTVDRLKAIGNGQVPIVAATAWNILMERIHNLRKGATIV